jgi:glycosyltransferase involved in cell wall biosynthesis
LKNESQTKRKGCWTKSSGGSWPSMACNRIEMRQGMKISVIIPAYNAERYIGKAIESCLSQTYAPHEIIVIDDASTDGTAAVAQSFPPPVRVIRLASNMGVSVARNRGVQASTGDWIAFLDADDWFLPEKLELQRQCTLENPQSVLIYTGYQIVDVDGSESYGRFVSPSQLWPMLRYKCAFLLSTVLLRRDAFDSVGGFDPAYHVVQDWDLWLRVAARYTVKLFAALPRPLIVYRRVDGSLTASITKYFCQNILLIESSCLLGTSGISRFLWRRRISAFSYYDTSITLREGGSLLDLQFILKSIVLWPFPWSEMPMRRYKVAAVMVRQHLFNRFFGRAFMRNRSFMEKQLK